MSTGAQIAILLYGGGSIVVAMLLGRLFAMVADDRRNRFPEDNWLIRIERRKLR